MLPVSNLCRHATTCSSPTVQSYPSMTLSSPVANHLLGIDELIDWPLHSLITLGRGRGYGDAMTRETVMMRCTIAREWYIWNTLNPSNTYLSFIVWETRAEAQMPSSVWASANSYTANGGVIESLGQKVYLITR
jgi:hypothetical protein